MKARLGKVLRSEFHSRMKTCLPEFQKIGTAFGGIVYRKRDEATNRYIFCFLCISPKLDRFTIELASAVGAEYPFHILPGETNTEGTVRTRIRSLLPPHEGCWGDDGWWNTNRSHEPDLAAIINTYTEEEIRKAEARVPELVQDAVDQLRSIAPKFIRSIQ